MCAGAGIPMNPFPDSDILKQQEARDERQNDAAAGATEVMRIMFFAEFFHGGQTPGCLALTDSKFGCARIVSCQSQFVAFKVYIVEVESEMARP